jgi:hypothetical protein
MMPPVSTKPPATTSSVWGWMPWALLFLISGSGHPELGVFAGLLTAAYPTLVRTARGLSTKLPDWMTLAFFVIAAASTLVRGSTLLLFWKYSLVIVWLLFAGMAWLSISLGAPFTLQYGREVTPPEYWQHPLFLRTSRILTLVWAAIFTANLVFVSALVGPVPPRGFAVFLPTLMVVGGFIFTARYSAAVSRRAAASFPPVSP